MKNILFQKQWNWKLSGIALALSFLAAVILVKPIGVSTQFVIADGIIWNAISSNVVVEDAKATSGYSSPNAYLNKSGGKYAKSVAKPINYSFIFVIAMVFGGFLGRLLTSTNENHKKVSDIWVGKGEKSSPISRYIVIFLGGVLALFGARLAGGCTSGHMMSGMMQTSLSGYLFAFAAFAFAIPTVFMTYKKKGE
jgi:uncharacterized membrane protein YedE/YeeE